MTKSSTVRENILAGFDNLPPKQRQLARFFLENEDFVAFASANDIGERVGTSAATVVRFCRALGYEGYTDLQAAVRRKYPQYRTTVQKMVERMANGNFAENLSIRVAQTNTQNIQETMDQVVDDQISAAAAAIIQAEEIRVFGSGLSAAACCIF